MKPKHFALPAFAALIVAIVWIAIPSPSTPPVIAKLEPRSNAPSGPGTIESIPGTTPPPALQTAKPTPPPVADKRDLENPLAPASFPLSPPPRPAEADPDVAPELDKIVLMLRDYRTITGENPVGTNAEIMKSILGENPRGAKLGPPEGMSLNGAGELVDHWGTPFFFHQLSKDLMEIHSAGPDRRMGTADDLVFK